MKAALVCTCVFLAAAAAQADPYQIAIQQAKRASDQNAAEQNRLQQAEGGSGAAANPGATPASPEMQATIKNISSLQKDIVALNAAADASAADDSKIALLNDLSTAAQGTKPAATSVRGLVKDLMAALTAKKVPAARQPQLAREIHAMFNASHLTVTQQQAILDDIQKVLTDSGVSLDAATDVVTDLKLVAGETK